MTVDYVSEPDILSTVRTQSTGLGLKNPERRIIRPTNRVAAQGRFAGLAHALPFRRRLTSLPTPETHGQRGQDSAQWAHGGCGFGGTAHSPRNKPPTLLILRTSRPSCPLRGDGVEDATEVSKPYRLRWAIECGQPAEKSEPRGYAKGIFSESTQAHRRAIRSDSSLSRTSPLRHFYSPAVSRGSICAI